MSIDRVLVKKVAGLEKETRGSRRVEVQKWNQHAFSHAISTMLMIPVLRGLWPCGPAGVSGELIDVQGLGNHLTLNGNPQFDYDGIIPYVAYDGTGDYHSITDAASSNAFDIVATAAAEPWVNDNGLTCWAWLYPEETSTLEDIITKWVGAGTRSYRLRIDASDQFTFTISDDGTNSDTATSAAVSVNNWYFVVGRFDPSTNVDIIVNGTEVNQATARASVFNSTSAFTIGARSGGANHYQGRVSLAGIAAAYLSDTLCDLMFYQTRALFGV